MSRGTVSFARFFVCVLLLVLSNSDNESKPPMVCFVQKTLRTLKKASFPRYLCPGLRVTSCASINHSIHSFLTVNLLLLFIIYYQAFRLKRRQNSQYMITCGVRRNLGEYAQSRVDIICPRLRDVFSFVGVINVPVFLITPKEPKDGLQRSWNPNDASWKRDSFLNIHPSPCLSSTQSLFCTEKYYSVYHLLF